MCRYVYTKNCVYRVICNEAGSLYKSLRVAQGYRIFMSI